MQCSLWREAYIYHSLYNSTFASGVEPTGTVVVLEASSTTDEDHTSVTIPVANMMVKQGYTVDVLYYSGQFMTPQIWV